MSCETIKTGADQPTTPVGLASRVTYVLRDKVDAFVASQVRDAEVVLDLGPGICPQPFVKKPYLHLCVEAHRPYLERVKTEVADDPRYIFINARWDEFIRMLPDKSVDSVFALDFIEHLEKADGFAMLREAERVARRQIVVYTPLGFYPQSYDDPMKPDRWGMDGGYWQTHRSGWHFDDFGEGWDFVCCPDYIFLDEDNQPLEEFLPAFWAIRNITSEQERRYVVRDSFEPDPQLQNDSAWPHFKKILEHTLPPVAFHFLRRVWRGALRLFHVRLSAGEDLTDRG